jgi:peroxiredoxin
MRIVYTACVVVFSALGCAGAAPPPVKSGAAPHIDAPQPTPSIAVTPDMGSPHIGDLAPDFELIDQDGKLVRLASLRGSVVLLAFATSWCPFSEAEQPNLKRLAEDYRSKNVRVVVVDVKEDDVGYHKYLSRVPMPIPVVRDTKGDVVLAYTPEHAQPEIKDRTLVLITSNLVIDQEGRVAFFTMADTLHFDARLVHARNTIDQLIAKEEGPKS